MSAPLFVAFRTNRHATIVSIGKRLPDGTYLHYADVDKCDVDDVLVRLNQCPAIEATDDDTEPWVVTPNPPRSTPVSEAAEMIPGHWLHGTKETDR